MSDAIVIESRHQTAGIAVRERGGYRFYASDSLFHFIDDRKFRRLNELQEAVEQAILTAREVTPPASIKAVPRSENSAPIRRSENAVPALWPEDETWLLRKSG